MDLFACASGFCSSVLGHAVKVRVFSLNEELKPALRPVTLTFSVSAAGEYTFQYNNCELSHYIDPFSNCISSRVCQGA